MNVAKKLARTLAFTFSSIFLLVILAGTLNAQTTVGTGSIVGIVSDPSRAAIGGARVTITNAETGQVIELITNPSGSFNSGALIPGNYTTLVPTENSVSR